MSTITRQHRSRWMVRNLILVMGVVLLVGCQRQPTQSGVQQPVSQQSLVASRAPIVRVVKLVRDYGAVVTVLALGIAFVPRWTVWLLVAFTVVNGLMLLASIAASARASLRRD